MRLGKLRKIDRTARRVIMRPGNNMHAASDLFQRSREHTLPILTLHGHEFPGTTQRRYRIDTLGDQPIQMRSQPLQKERAVFVKWRDR